MSYTKVSPTFNAKAALRNMPGLNDKALVIRSVDDFRMAVGSEQVVANHMGKCLSGNGSSKYLSHADDANLAFGENDFAISGLIKAATPSTTSRIVLRKHVASAGYMVELNTSGHLKLTIGDGSDSYSVEGSASVGDSKWHYFSFVIDRSGADGCILIVDGEIDGSATKTGTLADVGSIDNSNSLYIIGTGTASECLSGQMDEVRLFNFGYQGLHVSGTYAGGDLKITVGDATHGGEVTLFDQANERGMFIDMYRSPYTSLDDLGYSEVSNAEQTSIIGNEDLENWTGGALDVWSTYFPSGEPETSGVREITEETTDVQSGSSACRFYTNSDPQPTYFNIAQEADAVPKGKLYFGSFYLYYKSRTDGSIRLDFVGNLDVRSFSTTNADFERIAAVIVSDDDTGARVKIVSQLETTGEFIVDNFTIKRAGEIAHWKFNDDDAETDFDDETDNNFDLTITGGTTCSDVNATNYQVSPFIYNNFNPHTGTIAFRIKWFDALNDSTAHNLFYFYGDADNYIKIEKGTDNNLTAYFKYGGAEKSVAVDVSAWTAGTWYDIVIVWNAITKFDGTNHFKIYANESTTDAETVPANALEAVGSVIRAGHDGTSIADAILNFQIDDFPWYDTEANAIAAGFGKEKSVEYYHNSGNFNNNIIDAFTKAALLDTLSSNDKPQVGSVIFHAPLAEDTETTDGSTHLKAKVTGEASWFKVGQRYLIAVPIKYSNAATWADWFQSVEIDTGGITDNGDGTVTLTSTAALDAAIRANYTTANTAFITNNINFDSAEQQGDGAWEKSDVSILKDASDVFVGIQSIRLLAEAGTDYMYSQNIDVVAGENYKISLLTKIDSGNEGKVIVYDVTNSAAIVESAALTNTAWNLFESCFEIPTSCTEIQIRLYSDDINEYANYDCIAVLQNLIDNGGFEGTYSSDVAPGWTETGSPTVAESADEHTGDKAQSVNGDSSNYVYQDLTVESGKWYTISGWVKGANAKVLLTGAVSKTLSSTELSYRRVSHTFKATSTSLRVALYGDGVTAVFDDFALIPVAVKEFSTVTPSPMASCYDTDKWGNADRAFNHHGGSTIYYPSDGVLNTDLGTIVSLIQAPFDYDDYEEDFYLFDIENVMRMWYDASEEKFKFEIYDGSAWQTAESQAQTFSAGDWLYIFGLYNNASGLTIYVNDTQGTTVNVTWTAQTLPTNIYFWSDHDGDYQPDAIVDYPHGYDEWLTLSQIQSVIAGNWGSK